MSLNSSMLMPISAMVSAMSSIRRRRAQNGDTEIFHDLDLALGVAVDMGTTMAPAASAPKCAPKPPVNKP